MEYTYEQIQVLIIKQEVDGPNLRCVFQGEDSEKIFESSIILRRQNTVANKAKTIVKRNAFYFLRRQVAMTLSTVMGTGYVGRTARSIMYQSMPTGNSANAEFSEADIKAGVVKAFMKVADNFIYNPATGEWKTKKEGSLFEQQLRKAPVESGFERDLLARMLVAVAAADGRIAPEERDFLGTFIGPEIGTIDSLMRRTQISPIEFEETGLQTRDTMLMLSWVMALTDNDLDASEKALLEGFGQKMNVALDRQDELIRWAKYYIIETGSANGYSRNELYNIAQGIELSRAEAERCIIRHMKRNS